MVKQEGEGRRNDIPPPILVASMVCRTGPLRHAPSARRIELSHYLGFSAGVFVVSLAGVFVPVPAGFFSPPLQPITHRPKQRTNMYTRVFFMNHSPNCSWLSDTSAAFPSPRAFSGFPWESPSGSPSASPWESP